MIMKNLTPHPINFYIEGLPVVTLNPEPEPLRLTETDTRVSKEWVHFAPNTKIDNWTPEGNTQLALPIVKREYAAPPELPMPEPNVLLVVSLPALMGLRAAGVTRPDVVSFDTGPGEFGAVRDGGRRVIGCRRLLTIGEFPEGLYGGEGWSVEVWESANREKEEVMPL
jgi:hypothetical protein